MLSVQVIYIYTYIYILLRRDRHCGGGHCSHYLDNIANEAKLSVQVISFVKELSDSVEEPLQPLVRQYR